MTNPFDDDSAAFVAVPGGWSGVFGAADRASCLDYVGQNWTDMRPKSLVDEMNAAS
jgi:MbtH protein